jgi:hypothetical protein
MAVTAPEVMRARPANFHFVLAVIFAAVAFGGFFPTYLYPIATTGVHTSTVVHLHGLLFFGWTLLFVVQSRLAVTSIATHRSVGLVGISLATGMMFAALAVISGGLNEAVARGTETSARALATAPMFAIATFAVALVLALAYRRRAEYHKRLMVLATVALLPPAFARMLIVTIGGGGFGTRPALANAPPDLDLALQLLLVPAVLADLLLVIPAVYDWRTRGRPHAVYVVGGIAFFALQAVRPLVAATPVWHSITDGLIALTR